MRKQNRTALALVAGIVIVLWVWICPAMAASRKSGDNRETKSAAATPSPVEYAGVDACKACHEGAYKSFETTAHFKTTKEGGHGCESCHGPAAEHIAGGGEVSKIVCFDRLTRPEANARCLSCHAQKHEQRRFATSAHASSDVGCLDCHSPHHATQPEALLVKQQSNLCFDCHTAAKADFAKPFHHRVGEGLVQCSDCHNVHGSNTLRQMRASFSGDEACVKCHADKRGPFVYEHVPVKTEGCSSCHTPHGSTNARFLRVSQINLQCLQCHSFPVQGPAGPAHNEAAKYQACTMCHTSIHGSNASNMFFR
jgi:DmsE family decaheme c-type cytochrome